MKRFTKHFFVCACLLGAAATGFAQARRAVFNHVALSVYDLKESTSFYQDVLLLDTIPEPFRIGKHKWFEIAPGLSLHLIQDAPERKEHNRNTHICFSVPSIADFIDRLGAAGITYYNAGQEAGKVNVRVDGVQQLYIKDPDGYWIEINDEQLDVLAGALNR